MSRIVQAGYTVCMRHIGVVGITSALICMAFPAPANAGPIEEFAQILIHPGEPGTLAVRYVNDGGFLYSTDAGAHFGLGCGSMIAPGERTSGGSAITTDGSILYASSHGLWQGTHGGCDWGPAVGVEGQVVRDLIAHPGKPDWMLAVTWNGDPATMPNALWVRSPDGVWSVMGSTTDALLNRVRVAVRPSGAARFYVGGQRGLRKASDGSDETNYLIRVSDDDGQTWIEHDFDMDIGTDIFRIEAVDPQQPDRILASIDRKNGMEDSYLISDDQGATFTEYAIVTELGGVAVAPDGRVWLGDRGDSSRSTSPRGVWTAPSLAAPPVVLTAAMQIGCLTYDASADQLLACSRYSLGRIDLASGAFAPMLTFASHDAFLQCEDKDTVAVCKTQLCSGYCGPGHFASAPLCTAYHDPYCGPTADGAPSPPGTAGTTVASPPTGGAVAPRSSSAGCMAAPTPHGRGAPWIGAGCLVLAAAWRRARATASRRR